MHKVFLELPSQPLSMLASVIKAASREPPRTPNNKPDCLHYMHSINSVPPKKAVYLNSVVTDSLVGNDPVNAEEVGDSRLKQFLIIKATFKLFENVLNETLKSEE